jgi:hypothetical protein
MTASTTDKLIIEFLHSSLPKVAGEPTFENLKVIRRLLNTNAISVASYKGGGRHGHLGIIMTDEEYFAIAVDVFSLPNNPGPSAAVVAGMTAAVIAETTRLHKEATQVHRTYEEVDQAIKKLISRRARVVDVVLLVVQQVSGSTPTVYRGFSPQWFSP